MDRLDEIRALCEAATPGPWEQTRPDREYVRNTDDFNVCMTRRSYDAAFIAASRTLVPQLCDALEAAQKELIDYHHTQKVADGKAAENVRLRRINEQLTARAEAEAVLEAKK